MRRSDSVQVHAGSSSISRAATEAFRTVTYEIDKTLRGAPKELQLQTDTASADRITGDLRAQVEGTVGHLPQEALGLQLGPAYCLADAAISYASAVQLFNCFDITELRQAIEDTSGDDSMGCMVCLAERALDAVAVRVRNMCRAWAREARDRSLKINLAKRLRPEEDYGSSRSATRRAEIGHRNFQQRSAPVPASAAGPGRFTSEERQEAFRVKEILGGQDRVCFQFVKSGKRCHDCTFVPCNGRRERSADAARERVKRG